jgi:multicomponent Na+:H+ antiporter subunit D
MEYLPYTASHVLSQMQLLVFSALAFSWLMRNGIYPPELHSVNLDFDWTWRRLGLRIAQAVAAALAALLEGLRGAARSAAQAGADVLERLHGSEGVFARTWSTGGMTMWVALLLAAYLVLDFLLYR